MKTFLLSAAVLAVLISCSRGSGNDEIITTTTNPTSEKRLKQISQDGKLLNLYKWDNGKLIKIESYKDGFLDNYIKISNEGNIRKIDSLFDAKDTYTGRNIYSYNANNLLILNEFHKVGYFSEKRLSILRKLNQGRITQEQYHKEIAEMEKSYTPAIKNAISKIRYSLGSREYYNAIDEIEKTYDAPYREQKYSYDHRLYISKILTYVGGIHTLTREYIFSDDRKSLSIKSIFNDTTSTTPRRYTTAYTFDGKKGLYANVQPNKADYIYNTIKWQSVESIGNNTPIDNYESEYTYDSDDYPLTEVRTYESGKIVKRNFIWE